jgi:hypothetical protein
MSNNVQVLQAKLLQLLTDMELIKDMVKVHAIDRRISERESLELLRLIEEANDRALQ